MSLFHLVAIPIQKDVLTAEDEKFVDQAIEYMNLTDMQDKFLDELSGGQKQRAFIAMVIAQDTDYVLLDEPLNNLDMKHSVQIMKILRKLVDELGKTVVIVLHDINFASVYSDRIVALKDGKLVKNGPTHEIINSDHYVKFMIWIFQFKNKMAVVFVYISIHIQKLKPHVRSL